LRVLALSLAALFLAVPLRSAHAAGPRVVRNWPCSGCVVQASPSAKPQPLLVVLHGDEGDSAQIAAVWGPVAAARHMILFAPRCPAALGCPGSWWGWLQSGPAAYRDGWLGSQLAQVTARYRVDRTREYLAGWSGGADYLGWYALRHADRFAAAVFVAGGVPYVQACPARKLPAYFLLGGADPRYLSGQPSQVQHVLASCGSETKVVVVPGAGHQASIQALQSRGYAARIATWLLAYRIHS
jgi:poly(3-hydroxybutyrate) depolymerase